MSKTINDFLVLVCGESASGKSAALMNLPQQEGVMYLNCEAGKKLPFKNKFMNLTVTDPMQVYEAFEGAEKMPNIHTIVVDSLTFLMDMYESLYVLNSTNTMKMWGEYNQYFKTLMQNYVAKSTKNVIFTAHVMTTLNEEQGVMETKIPIKGALKGNGLEAYFSCIVYAKKRPMKVLCNYASDLLHIQPDEEAVGYKHVFQTKITKDNVNERIRSPLGMFTNQETYMDNDVSLLLRRLHEYYAD